MNLEEAERITHLDFLETKTRVVKAELQKQIVSRIHRIINIQMNQTAIRMQDFQAILLLQQPWVKIVDLALEKRLSKTSKSLPSDSNLIKKILQLKIWMMKRKIIELKVIN